MKLSHFIIRGAKQSAQAALDEFFTQKGAQSVSRQALAKARENIKHEALLELNDAILEHFETEGTDI